MEDQPNKFLHIAVFPWLAFGHISPFFQLSKLIAQKGHTISFISTPRNIKRLPPLPPNLQPFINFVELPFPHIHQLPQNAEATMDIPQHIVPYLNKAFDGLQQPFTQFLETSTPDCIICDFAPYWLPPITSKLGVLSIYFNTVSSSSISYVVGKSNDEDNFISHVHYEQYESGVSDMFRLKETIFGAEFIAVRSCMEIEGKAIESIENQCKKKVIPVGLLPPSLEFSEDKKDENWDTILKWLDKHEKKSVVYVEFGTEVTLSDEEITEIAKGLESSSFPFLWIVKNHDWFVENDSNKNGLIWSNWAPQLRILEHESIGGFLTHCGWSSLIESFKVGCPLIMLPFQSDQGVNARLMEEKMVGIKVERNDGKINRDSVAKALRLVMVEEEGKIYRSKAEEMSKIVGDKELHQKYIDDFVDYVELHIPASKH
ncbi:unnamed protein product [Lathyrus oleraceus]|uniref:putative UDP-rhamnose:rhamnosyltransferase 1 n=1 Tax=Pisum sativum TaxID=3888 RepID=UPI0021CE082F|nr:putative UDP-rhamnose:rhamnosyltransferase 1 [Pisum sativum]